MASMAKNRMELIESWMASAETPAAVYDDERNERERKQTGQLFVYIFPFVRLSSTERDERRENG
jgi:hypothetical protein